MIPDEPDTDPCERASVRNSSVKTEEGQWLTTGQAAKYCSVKPDTVLKWIKRGRLTAERTPGGHYRIRPKDLEPLILTPRQVDAPPRTDRLPPQALRCWEYLGSGGSTSEECRECIVFRSRAAWCFQMVEVARETGHALIHCQESCDECAYFRRVKGLATSVLVVTEDRALTGNLRAEENEAVHVRFAANGYEASAVIQELRPAFVVVDHALIRSGEAKLLDRLEEDPRIPGVRAILAVDKGKAGRARAAVERSVVVGVVEKPFGLEEVASVIDAFPVEAGAPDESASMED